MKSFINTVVMVGIAFLVSGCKGKVETACSEWDSKADCSCAQTVVDKLTDGAADKEAKVGLVVSGFKRDKLAAQNYASQLGFFKSTAFYAVVADAWRSNCQFRRLP